MNDRVTGADLQTKSVMDGSCIWRDYISKLFGPKKLENVLKFLVAE